MNKSLLLSIHDKSWEDAKEYFPVLELNELINVGTAYLNSEISIDEILKKYGSYYAEAAKGDSYGAYI